MKLFGNNHHMLYQTYSDLLVHKNRTVTGLGSCSVTSHTNTGARIDMQTVKQTASQYLASAADLNTYGSVGIVHTTDMSQLATVHEVADGSYMCL
ncbi:hypothetical protein BaRGS_00026358 [Batillaria attramentaria]|uniref:Uncharacterized protein n=1 Tax=Batillaria attramentaria TaxID=370345 RepID=A0ABD0K518_9CAEN